MLSPCVVPCVQAFLHTTTELQAVCGEGLWPASQQDDFSLRTLWSDTKWTLTRPNQDMQTTLWQINQQLAFNTEVFRQTGVWCKGELGFSSSSALIGSSVIQRHRIGEGEIVSRDVDWTLIFEPQKLPSSWNVYMAEEWNGIFSVHQVVIRWLDQLNCGFCIWGIMLESI